MQLATRDSQGVIVGFYYNIENWYGRLTEAGRAACDTWIDTGDATLLLPYLPLYVLPWFERKNRPLNLEDVVVPVRQQQSPAVAPLTAVRRSDVEYVYVIASSDVPDMYKIGRAKDLRTRLSTLQISTPSALVLIHIIATTEPELIESILHTVYADKRVRGEWFRLTPDDVEKIKQIRGRS